MSLPAPSDEDGVNRSAGGRRLVGIVGGGWGGLSLAAWLRGREGIDVRLYEASDRVGGKIRTEVIDDYRIDWGADMFATRPDAVVRLCEKIGVAEPMIEPETSRRGAAVVRSGRLRRIPEGFVLARPTRRLPMLTTGLLGPLDKLRLLTEPFRAVPADAADESVAAFVRRRMGRGVAERIVQPLVGGIYTGDIEKLSMAATLGQIRRLEREHGSLHRAARAEADAEDARDQSRQSSGARYGGFRSFSDGMETLPRSVAASLSPGSICVDTAVNRLVRDGRRWRIEGAAGRRIEGAFDDVVIALPPEPAASLLRPHAPIAATALDDIESTSAVVVVLAVRREDIRRNIDYFGFVVPQRERRDILAGSFASHKFPGRCPDDEVLIRVFMGGALRPELNDRDDADLIRLASDDLRELIGWSGMPRLTRVIRWPASMPNYHVGHLDRVRTIETAIEAVPGLHLLTNAVGGVGIAPVCVAAEQMAGRLAAV